MEPVPDTTENDQNYINIMGPEFNMLDSQLVSNDSGISSHIESDDTELSTYNHYTHMHPSGISPALAYSISLDNATDIQERMYASNLTINTAISPGSIIGEPQHKLLQPIVTNAMISPPSYSDSSAHNLAIASPIIHQTTVNINISGSPISHDISHLKHLQLEPEIPSANLSSDFSGIIGNGQVFDTRDYSPDGLQYGTYTHLLTNAPVHNSSLHSLERPMNSYIEENREAILEPQYAINSLKRELIGPGNGDILYYPPNSLDRYGLSGDANDEKYGLTIAGNEIVLASSVRGKAHKPTISGMNNPRKTALPSSSYVVPELQIGGFSPVELQQANYQQPHVSPHCQPDNMPNHNIFENSIRIDNLDQGKHMFTYNNYLNDEYAHPTISEQLIPEKASRKAPTRATRSKAKRTKAASPINIDIDGRKKNATDKRHKSESYDCCMCKIRYDTRSVLRKHLTDVHGDPGPEPADDPKKKYKCTVKGCLFITRARGDLDEHLKQHIAEGYTPTGKIRAGKSKGDLMRHRYNKEEFHCVVCSYSCTTEAAFQRHMKAHERGQIDIHVSLSCAVCGEDFADEQELKQHMKIHKPGSFFLCDVCSFHTIQLKKLIQHRRMHTGEKPHICPHCQYRAARRDNLRSHVRRMHRKKNMYCDTFNPRSLVNAEITILGERVGMSEEVIHGIDLHVPQLN